MRKLKEVKRIVIQPDLDRQGEYPDRILVGIEYRDGKAADFEVDYVGNQDMVGTCANAINQQMRSKQ